MENIGDWIWIIILIGYGLFKVVGNAFKTPPSEMPEGEVETAEWKEENTSPQMQFTRKVASLLRQSQPQPQPVVTKAVRAAAQVRQPFEPTQLIEEESGGVNLNLSDRDELKRAIIYAEIFHRKYE